MGRWKVGFVTVWAFFGLYALGTAGQYVKRTHDPQTGQPIQNPSGGQLLWGPPPNVVPYVKNGDSYGNGAYDPYFVQCTGTITTIYDWVRDQIPDPNNPGSTIPDPLDNPPDEVISAEYCLTNYDVYGVDPAGFCDNGLGFTPNETIEVGHRWGESVGTLFTKRTGGDTVTLTCTPAALATTTSGLAYASVTYRSAIIVPRVTFVGVTRFDDPHAYKFLTGQQVTCSVSMAGVPQWAPQLTVQSRKWDVEGGTAASMFKSFLFPTHGAPSFQGPPNGGAVLHSKGDAGLATFSFYTIDNGPLIPSCALTISLPANSLFAGGLPAFQAKSLEFHSVRPVCNEWIVQDGLVGINTITTPSRLEFGADAGTGVTHGQVWSDITFTVPAPFPQAGQGSICQLFNGNRLLQRITTPPWRSNFIKYPWNGQETLDVSFPPPAAYAPIWNLPAVGGGHDSPWQALEFTPPPGDFGGTTWNHASATDSLKTWAMFRPPAVGSQPTTWIPMARYTWQWGGIAQKSGSSWVLNQGSGYGSHTAVDKNFKVHPTWTKTTPLNFGMIGN